MGFGDFDDICQKAALPFCPLVGSSPVAPESGVLPACYSRTIELANTVIFQGAASFVHIGALIMVVIMILHIRSKFTAVGRKEISIFFYIFLLVEVFSLLLDAGVVPPGSGALPYFAAVQIGLASAACLCLCVNGFLGFQVYEDGTTLSVMLLSILSAAWFAVAFLVALLTFKGWGGLGPENTVGLFVVMYILNAILLAVYVTMQVLLVLGTLEDRWPLGDIAFGVFFFVVGQVILYTLGNTICNTAQHYLDGLFFSSICNLLAVMMVYKFWDSITTEDLEFSVGARAGAWDAKDGPLPPPDDPFDAPSSGWASARGSARHSVVYNLGGADSSQIGLAHPSERNSVIGKGY